MSTGRASPSIQDNLVSVIVPAFNAAATIGDCLRALRRQDYVRSYEVIVVDDGSEDNTGAIAEEMGAKVVHIPRSRPAAARNAGISAAVGAVICCTDADCLPVADWLTQITLPFSDPVVAACKGTYKTHQRSLVARFVQLEYEDKYDFMAQAATIDFIDTYSAAYRRSVLIENGGFDERFVYLEDQELSFRLAAGGQTMVFQPSAVVYHQHADSLWAYMRKKATIGYWKAQVVRRFPERAVRDSHTPQVIKVQLLLAAMALVSLTILVGSAVLGWPGGRSVATISAVVAILLFVATAIPFCIKAWSKDRAVSILAPGLLFARALALGSGTLWGMVAPPPGLESPWPIGDPQFDDEPS